MQGLVILVGIYLAIWSLGEVLGFIVRNVTAEQVYIAFVLYACGVAIICQAWRKRK